MPTKAVWKVFVRRPGATVDYAALCHRAGIVGIGWSWLGERRDLESREAVARAMRVRHGGSLSAARNRASSFCAFRDEMKVGDYIVAPDSEHGTLLLGVVESESYFVKAPKDGFEFGTRRKVRWKRTIAGTLPGAIQTVSRVRQGADRLIRALGRAEVMPIRRASRTLPMAPDAEWGRAAEERALAWLRGQGFRPKDVARDCLGWDIEVGDSKYEVKGRRTTKTAIKLTENEWKAARRHGKRYTLLIFTAATSAELRGAKPREVIDPARFGAWRTRRVLEYLSEEL